VFSRSKALARLDVKIIHKNLFPVTLFVHRTFGNQCFQQNAILSYLFCPATAFPAIDKNKNKFNAFKKGVFVLILVYIGCVHKLCRQGISDPSLWW